MADWSQVQSCMSWHPEHIRNKNTEGISLLTVSNPKAALSFPPESHLTASLTVDSLFLSLCFEYPQTSEAPSDKMLAY